MIAMLSRSRSLCGFAAVRSSAFLRAAILLLFLLGSLFFFLPSAQAQLIGANGSCSITVTVSPSSPTLCVGQTQHIHGHL